MSASFDATEHWRVDHEAGVTLVDEILSPQSAPKVGDTPSWTLNFRGGTGVPTDFHDRFDAIFEFAEYAGLYASNIMSGNHLVYAEQISASNESLLVALRPPADSPTLRGVWGLVNDVSDETDMPQTKWRLDVSLEYIAPLSKYADHAAVREAHEKQGFH